MPVPTLTGSWIGTVTYGEPYKTMAGKTMDFKIDIENETFTGGCLDLDDLGKYTGISAIIGNLDGNKINFTKQYPVRRIIGIKGIAFIKPNEPGILVNYTGTWNNTRGCFEGVWDIEKKGIGTWEMTPGNVEETINDDISIHVNFDKSDLTTVLFTNLKKTASKRVRHSLIAMLCILLFGTLSYEMMMIYESLVWTILLMCVGWAFIWSIERVVKNTKWYNEWKKESIKYINVFVDDKSHTLIVSTKSLIIKTSYDLGMIEWKDIKGVNFHDGYFTLMDIYPIVAATMKDEEYQLIKKYIETYTPSGLYNSK